MHENLEYVVFEVFLNHVVLSIYSQSGTFIVCLYKLFQNLYHSLDVH